MHALCWLRALVLSATFSGCGFPDPPRAGPAPCSNVNPCQADFVCQQDVCVRNCFGEGDFKVCLDVVPTQPLALNESINTTNDSKCVAVSFPDATEAQPAVCAIIGSTITVPATATVDVSGERPLVLIATATMAIEGTLDAAAKRGGKAGPGTSPTLCTAGPAAADGGGGGAGGSFFDTGGGGGPGNSNAAAGGMPGPTVGASEVLRAGCPGQNGGNGTGGNGGTNGNGGGALYLIAQTSIDISGIINASGAAGRGGDGGSGGGGGGSGGMIVLHSAAITTRATAVIMANGGGGASGASSSISGTDAVDPSAATPLVPSAGATGAGATGGRGTALVGAAGGGGGGLGDGGGGGGGGKGFILTNQLLGGMVAPAATER